MRNIYKKSFQELSIGKCTATEQPVALELNTEFSGARSLEELNEMVDRVVIILSPFAFSSIEYLYFDSSIDKYVDLRLLDDNEMRYIILGAFSLASRISSLNNNKDIYIILPSSLHKDYLRFNRGMCSAIRAFFGMFANPNVHFLLENVIPLLRVNSDLVFQNGYYADNIFIAEEINDLLGYKQFGIALNLDNLQTSNQIVKQAFNQAADIIDYEKILSSHGEKIEALYSSDVSIPLCIQNENCALITK